MPAAGVRIGKHLFRRPSGLSNVVRGGCGGHCVDSNVMSTCRAFRWPMCSMGGERHGSGAPACAAAGERAGKRLVGSSESTQHDHAPSQAVMRGSGFE